MHRWLTLALVGITLAVGALTLGTAPLLPDRVATHFDWNGRPNGWMDRETYVVFALAFSVMLPWLVYAVTTGLLRRFPRLASLRDKDYWLAPPRRDATVRALRAFAAATALLIACFAATMHLAILQAHATQSPHLDNTTFGIAVALFVIAVVGIAVAHGLRFRRPRDRAALQP